MPQLGLHTLAVTPLWNPDEADDLLPPLVEHGVRVIETPLLDLANYDSAGTRAAAERHGVRIVCSLGLPDDLDVAADHGPAAGYLEQALNVAKAAGADVLSGVTYGTIGKTSGAPATTAETDAICRLLERIARTARGMNMTLGIEPCNRYETHLLNTARQGADLIERIGADNVFLHLDTYHMNIEEAGLGKGLKDAGPHLGYLHLSESNRGVPGTGNIDWPGVFDGVAETGYDGPLTLESFVHLAPEIAAGLAVWRPVAERPRDVIDIGLPFIIDQAARAGITFDR